MTSQAAVATRPPPEGTDDSAKRRQIMDGARAIFLTQGFDAASMGEIARAAGVSKGTLYVYFENKEQLFEAIVHEQCMVQAEGLFDLDPTDGDVEAVLTKLGIAFVNFLCQPGKAVSGELLDRGLKDPGSCGLGVAWHHLYKKVTSWFGVALRFAN